jgi:threonine/homoserine/homoserine lactone efflux protein
VTWVLAFALVAALLTVTPGIDTALVIRSTLSRGRSAGLRTSAGVCTGVMTWGLLSAVGVSAVLTASRVAYDVLRVAGAAYLLFLGVRTLLDSRRSREGAGPVGAAGDEVDAKVASQRRGAGFRTGMVTNLLNPKVGVFYVTLLPQFIPAGVPVLPASLLLAGIHAVEGIVWLTLVTLAVSRARAVMRRASVRRWLERTTGAVLIGFGARVALERL